MTPPDKKRSRTRHLRTGEGGDGFSPAPEPEETPEGYRYPEAPIRYTAPDAEYVADLEQSDSQRRKRMDQRLRGRPVRPPREP